MSLCTFRVRERVSSAEHSAELTAAGVAYGQGAKVCTSKGVGNAVASGP